MQQRVLVIKIGRGKIISRPWNFEAMCIVDDARLGEENPGVLKLAIDAVFYLFEGTGATEEYLKKLPEKTMMDLCMKVWTWYSTDLIYASDIISKGKQSGEGEKIQRLRDVYRSMLQNCFKLPDEVGRQIPRNVFYVLAGKEETPEDKNSEILTTGCAVLYGM